MKRVFCPKCDHQLTFDETKYKEGEVVAFVCPQCASQFKIKISQKTATSKFLRISKAKYLLLFCCHTP